MVQAAVLYGLSLDPASFSQDGFASAEVDIFWRQIAEALVVSPIVVVINKGGDSGLKLAFKEVIFQQDAVFEGLMSTLDLALGLGMHGRASDVFHALIL